MSQIRHMFALYITSAESPPSKNLDHIWSGFFYWKCRSKPCQLRTSGVLWLNGLGWLNVLMSIGNGGHPINQQLTAYHSPQAIA